MKAVLPAKDAGVGNYWKALDDPCRAGRTDTQAVERPGGTPGPSMTIGTGYSHCVACARFPLDKLKIDKQLPRWCAAEPARIISLVTIPSWIWLLNMRLPVVAEGVGNRSSVGGFFRVVVVALARAICFPRATCCGAAGWSSSSRQLVAS